MANTSSSPYPSMAAGGDVAVLPPQSPPVLAPSASSSAYFFAGGEEPQQREHQVAEDERCRSCSARGALVTDWAQGDRVCTQCGVVHAEQLVDAAAEWRDYDQDGGGASSSSSRARSGLVAVDEARYAGGLQPTTLSRTVFGQSSESRAGGGNNNSWLLRQRLSKINRRMDRLMERRHRAAYRDAAASVRRRRQQEQQQQQQLQDDTTDADTVDDSINTNTANNSNSNVEPPNYGSNHVWISEDSTATTTTETLDEIEEHVREREEAQTVRRRALEAEKWSLERAQRVGRADEDARALPEYRASTNHNNTDQGDGDVGDDQWLDEKHRAASRELFAAYQVLAQACEQLRLPVALRDEAAAVLARYAARRDGLKVKGVAVVARRRNDTASNANRPKKHQTLEQQQQREHNRVRQRGALCAAIVFWTARQRQQPRSLVQVCETVSTAASPQVPIQRKHCSKAMAELKEHLPDWANLAASNNAATSAAFSLVDSSASSVGSSSPPAAQVASVAYVTEHTLRKLNLPLVAEAAVRYLVLHQLLLTTTTTSKDDAEDAGNKKLASTATALPTRCAATAYFVCRAGSALQHLASEAQRAAVRQRQQQVQQQEQQRPSPPQERNKKRKWNDDDDSSSRRSNEHDYFHVLDTATLRSEQQAYETQRLWDAWAEQLPWSRAWAEVEPLPGVGKQAAWELYRDELFPARQRLLEELARAVVVQQQLSADNVSGKSGSTDAVLEQERAVLREASLASILLPRIASAAPLMKADKRL